MTDFFHTFIGKTAKQRVSKVLETGWLNEGQQVRKFEQRLSHLFDFPYVLTVNSCSSALLLCLLDIGVKDYEVILPSQTFIATGMAVLAAGGIPVFADIDPNTGNLCPKSLKDKITCHTKAIIAVHWAGNPCPMQEITGKFPVIQDAAAAGGIPVFADIDPNTGNLCPKSLKDKITCHTKAIIAVHWAGNPCPMQEITGKFPVIQDAAHALGTTIAGKSIVHFSDYSCFSFQSIKHLTTGDGGAICTSSPSIKLKKMKWFGIDKTKISKDEFGGRLPDVEEFGFKWHMNDLAAALGLANLVGYKRRLQRRRDLAKRYEEGLKDIPGISLLKLHGESAYWMFTLRVEGRKDLCKKLKVYSTVDYGIQKNPIFKVSDELPGQDLFDKTQLSLPVHDNISEEMVEETIRTIRLGW
jgi:perosamine synthetase